MSNDIIIFDGDCFFCNKFILTILNNDNGKFKIVDQWHSKFNDLLKRHSLSKHKETIYYIKNESIVSDKSDAVINILKKCKPAYKKYRFKCIIQFDYLRGQNTQLLNLKLLLEPNHQSCNDSI